MPIPFRRMCAAIRDFGEAPSASVTPRVMVQVDVHGYDGRGIDFPHVPPFYAEIPLQDETVEDERHEEDRADNECGEEKEIVRNSELAHTNSFDSFSRNVCRREGVPLGGPKQSHLRRPFVNTVEGKPDSPVQLGFAQRSSIANREV